MGFKIDAAERELNVRRPLHYQKVDTCGCGTSIYIRGGTAGDEGEWAHFDAFDESDRTRCPDGASVARPARVQVDA